MLVMSSEFVTCGIFNIFFRPMFKISEDRAPEKCLVIIQCDSGHLNGDLIACARYRIYDLRAKADDRQITHVLFIIHLPHHIANSSFVGFQGDPWISSHIDDLRPTSDNAVSANEAIGLSISELFLGRLKSNEASLQATGSTHTMPQGFSDNRDESVEMRNASFSEDEAEEQEGDERMLTEDEIERDEGREGRWAHSVQDEDMEAEEVLGSSRESAGPDMVVEDIESEEVEDERSSRSLNRENNNEIELAHDPSSSDALLSHGRPSVPLQMQIVQACHDEQPTRSPLFRRLHGSIQEAASRLKDSSTKRSTKRVEILVHLIPKEPPKIPGKKLYSQMVYSCIS